MKKAIFFLWIPILFSIFLFTCQSDTFSDLSIRSILVNGVVTDEQGQPVDGASVEFGSEKTSTNEVGYFEFPTAKYQEKVFIKVHKQGYFPGSRTLFLKSSKSAEVHISLLQKTFSKSFQSNSGGIVLLNNKVSLNFPANSILNADATPYQGTVQIAIQYLDPSSNTIHEIMPGNLIGLNTAGEMQVLGSYAMAAIELQSPSGALLQLDKTKGALLKLEIPQSLQATAPPTIPLWYFDEASGLWKEEGAAIKNGNVYEGRVNHFSFWNCDISALAAYLTGKLVRAEGRPIPNTIVVLTILRNNTRASAITNFDGIFEGIVPQNEKFNMEVIDFCGKLIYQELIGPFDADVDLGQIILPFSDDYILLNGQIIDATQHPLPDLSIHLIADGNKSLYLKSNVDGSFSFHIPSCLTGELTLTIYGSCDDLLFIKKLEPQHADLDLGQIIIQNKGYFTQTFNGRILKSDNQGIPDLTVYFKGGNNNLFQTKTDQEGKFHLTNEFCGSNSVWLIIKDHCNSVIENRLINLDNPIMNLGNIIIQTGALEKIPVDGKIVDCIFNPIPNVSVLITSGMSVFKTITDNSGYYSILVPFCNTDKIGIKAYDSQTQIFSEGLTYGLPGPIHVATLQICKTLINSDEYLTYQFSDGTTGSNAFNLTLENSFGLYSFFTNTSDPWFELKWNGPGSVGTKVPIKEISLRNSGTYYIAKYYNNTDGTILFKSVPKASGEFFEGTFEGINVKKQDVKTGQLIETGLTVNGSFKIKKE
jgi:hypothetical protein